MSAAGRGPTGAAPLPPPWLGDTDLPLLEWPSLASLHRIHRIHRLTQGPIHFSGSKGGPVGRFDSPSGAFGVLYLAESFHGAFAETLLRNPQRRVVGLAEITVRAVTVLGLARTTRLVDMRGAGLQALGTDNAVTTGPYAPCGAWSDALFDHRDRPDGIAYSSRHDPEQVCIALFSRPDIVPEVLGAPTPLADMPAEVAAALRRYGKGLIP